MFGLSYVQIAGIVGFVVMAGSYIVPRVQEWRQKRPATPAKPKPGTTVAATQDLEQRLAAVLAEYAAMRESVAKQAKQLESAGVKP